MRSPIKRLWDEDDGVLSFEWTLLVTLLAVGIVGGLSAARDAIIDELGDTAQVMVAFDQSYHVGMPLALVVHDPALSGSGNSTFTDALAFTDCDRVFFIGQDLVDDGPEP